MERIRQLIKRLTLLGYCTFEIRNILKDATGNDSVDEINFVQLPQVIRHLERYEQLGSYYLQTYSK